MNWDALGAIAELAGALGVMVSLAYLAIQIRQNTRQMKDQGKALRLNAQETISTSFSRFRDHLIRAPELATLWLRGLGGALASPVDEMRFGLLLQEAFFSFQGVFTARTDGTRRHTGRSSSARFASFSRSPRSESGGTRTSDRSVPSSSP